jgi:hypothetical protein
MNMRANPFLKSFFLSFLIISIAFAHDHIPGHTHGDGYMTETRILKKAGNHLVTFMHEQQRLVENRELNLFELSDRFRLHKNLLVGMRVRAQTGLQYDEDWIKDENGEWVWQDTSRRLEYEFGIFATGRAILDFLPGKNWLGTFTVDYNFNEFNDFQTLQFAPDLTYRIYQKRKLKYSLYARYYANRALNYGDEGIVADFLATGGLVHLNKSTAIGLDIFYKKYRWFNTQGFFMKKNDTFESENRTIGPRLRVLIKL